MPIRTLTSKSNPLVRTIRLVAGQARRAPADLVVAEGVRALEEALAAGLDIEAVIVTERYGKSERETDLLGRVRQLSSVVCRAPEDIFGRLSSVQTPQGILALVRLPVLKIAAVVLPETPLLLCACGIQDPGNLGALIRSAAAAGASFACSLAGTVSARNPKALRASAGAIFRLPVVEGVAAAEFLAFCRQKSISLFCATARGGASCFETDFRQPCAILLGNEGAGVDDSLRSGLPGVSIPMNTAVESLNVAAAGAVLLFEASRQRALSG